MDKYWNEEQHFSVHPKQKLTTLNQTSELSLKRWSDTDIFQPDPAHAESYTDVENQAGNLP